MNDKGQWRLACVDLRVKTVVTYDLMKWRGPRSSPLAHYKVLLDLMAPEPFESERWQHIYMTCPTSTLPCKTGVMLLKILGCALRNNLLRLDLVRAP